MVRIAKSILRLLPVLLLAQGDYIPVNYFASPQGSEAGEGTFESPWDLQTALSHPVKIQPGDRLWLRGGTYTGTFVSRLAGSKALPIIVRNYGNERAILDYPGEPKELQVLRVDGAWTWYWGLELTSSWEPRIDPPTQRATGLSVYGNNIKLINLVVHDTFGLGFWTAAENAEIYGSIVYNNGQDQKDRGHGHGIYAQNRNGYKLLTDNIVFQNFSHGIHIFGSNEAFLNNFHLEGNVAFNNGVLSRFGEERNILLGGGVLAQSPELVSNFTYWSRSDSLGQNNIGYLAGCDHVRATDNYFAGGVALILIKCPAEQLEGNTFIGSVSGFDRLQFTNNTYHPYGSKPAGEVKVFVRPNRYEPGRAHIVVYNWALQNEVSVNLENVLIPGQAYEIRDVQNLFGPPVVQGIYDGGGVMLPMNLHEVSATVGAVPVAPAHTSAEFGVFLVHALPRAPTREADPSARRPGTPVAR